MFQSKTKIAAKVSARLNGDAANVKPEVIRKWYNHAVFPLIPEFRSRPADEYNTYCWWFNWTFIRVWSLDSFCFELAVVMDGHWGIGVTVILPYIRIVVAIPCPYFIGYRIQKYLWRKPKK